MCMVIVVSTAAVTITQLSQCFWLMTKCAGETESSQTCSLCEISQTEGVANVNTVRLLLFACHDRLLLLAIKN